MRRAVALLLVTGLFLSSVATAQAAVKSGAKCNKLGATATVSGKKYTCIKSGKTLVWNKGVAISTKPTPTPVPTESIPAGPQAPSSFADLIENYKGISFAAWNRARQSINSSSSTGPDYNLFVGPNSSSPVTRVDLALRLVNRLHPTAEPPQQLFIIAFNYQDRDWATEKMDEYMPSAGSAFVKQNACETVKTCWGGGAFADDAGRILLVITTDFADANHTEGTLEAHEYTHALQLRQMRVPSLWPRPSFWPPTWMWEGHAQFAQNAAIFSNDFDKYKSRRYRASKELFGDSQYTSQFLVEYFQLVQSRSWFDKYDRWRQYDLGAMFVEVLVALKGTDSVIELWKNTSQGKEFKTTFERIYGMNFDSALPIMAEAISLEIQHPN